VVDTSHGHHVELVVVVVLLKVLLLLLRLLVMLSLGRRRGERDRR
jgi:hypothetical protein